MPEMPELEVLCEVIGARVEGRSISAVTVSPKFGYLLRTPPDDMARTLVGRSIDRMWRRGKFLVFDVGNMALVINPMLSGRLHWSPVGAKPPPSTLVAMELDGGDVLRLTDFARTARVYLTPSQQVESIPGWSDIGPEADTISLDEFLQRIRRHPGEVKNLLRNQAFIAGVGNSYSDEILFEAGFHPMRKRSTLKPADLEKLHASIGLVLRDAVRAIRANPDYVSHKQDRSFMKVHMRGGEACPRCGHRIAEIKAGGEITNYCRACQP